MRRKLGALACTTFILMAGCTALNNKPLASIALPSDGWKPGNVMMLALISGPFHASLRNGIACAWLGPGHLAFLWPAGYRVSFHPTELIDGQGHIIVREGGFVSFGGGIVPVKPGEAGTQCKSTKRYSSQYEVVQGISHVGHVVEAG